MVTTTTYNGQIDLLIISPPSGNGSDPVHQVLKPDQVKSDSATVYLKFLKEQKMPGEYQGWSWTFDPVTKVWYQIDNLGNVRAATSLLAASRLTCLRRVFVAGRLLEARRVARGRQNQSHAEVRHGQVAHVQGLPLRRGHLCWVLWDTLLIRVECMVGGTTH